MRANILLFGFAFLALALAGCTGDFNVRQTEPIKVQIDGEAEETRLAAGGDDGAARESEFRIENPDDVEVVTVVVQVVKVEAEDADEPGDVDQVDDDETNETEDDDANESDDGAEPTVILVLIEDGDTGERLQEQRVEASDDDSAQAELNVNVKGKDNIVVVTQAVQGAAHVTVSAKEGSETGPGDMETEDDAENNTTAPRY